MVQLFLDDLLNSLYLFICRILQICHCCYEIINTDWKSYILVGYLLIRLDFTYNFKMVEKDNSILGILLPCVLGSLISILRTRFEVLISTNMEKVCFT